MNRDSNLITSPLVVYLLICLGFSGIIQPLEAQNPTIDSLELLLKENKTLDTHRVLRMSALARLYHRSQPPKALKIGKEMVALSKQLSYAWGEALGYEVQGHYFNSRAEYEKAISMYEKVLELQKNSERLGQMANSYGNIAITYQKIGKYRLAKRYLEKTLAMKVAQKDSLGIGISYYELGNTANKLRHSSDALRYYQQSFKIANAIGDREGVAYASSALGGVYLKLKKYSEARQYLEKDLAISQALDIKSRIGLAYLDLAKFDLAISHDAEYLKGKKLDLDSLFQRALKNLGKARKIFEENDIRSKVANLDFELGDFYYNYLKDIPKAIAYYQKSLQLAEEIKDLQIMGENYLMLADIYARNDKLNLAEEYYQKTIRVSHQMPDPSLRKDAWKALSVFKESQKNFAASLNYLKKYNHLKDSLKSSEERIKTSELSLIYEQENKVRQLDKQAHEIEEKRLALQKSNLQTTGLIIITLLLSALLFTFWYNRKKEKQINQQLFEQNQRLLRSKEEISQLAYYKEKLSSMIVHDLKNPLNALLNLPIQKERVAWTRVKQLGQQMLNLVLNILDVQRFEEAKIELNNEALSLQDIMNKSIQDLYYLSQKKNIVIECVGLSPNLYFQGDAQISRRIFVNLLNNALKFSPQNSRVLVKVEELDEKLKISIQDEGRGIKEEHIPYIFDKFATFHSQNQSSLSSSGLGLTFTQLAVKAQGGEIGLQSTYGQGSTFWLSLKSAEAPLVPENELDLSPKPSPSLAEGLPLPDLESQDLEVLSAIKSDLLNLEVYFHSELEEVLNKVDFTQSSNLENWFGALKNAIENMNPILYERLVKQI